MPDVDVSVQRSTLDSELSLASRAAWLSHVGGLRQQDIASMLGVSRIKVNRLIALAQRRGLIKVFVEGEVIECIGLEEELRRRFGLSFCEVVPSGGDEELPLRSLANAGARFLLGALERPDLRIVGIGHGRTLSATVDALPRVARTDVRFVSLLGSLTRNAAANPFDVIHRLALKVGGQSYFLPVPFFADSIEDKRVLMAQRTVGEVFELAHRAQLSLVGIGEISARAHMLETGTITEAELAQVSAAGAVGEVLGHFVDSRGRPVAAEINERALGLKVHELKGREVVAVAGGRGKARAILAVLRSGGLSGLITDEDTARRINQRDDETATPAAAE